MLVVSSCALGTLDWIEGALVNAGTIGAVALGAGGFCLLLTSIFDDHLKNRILWKGHGKALEPTWFKIYVTRIVCWIVAVVPVVVLFFAVKLTLFPLLVFRSLDPFRALHAKAFFKPLYNFLDNYHTSLRLKVANKFVLQCRACTDLANFQIRVNNKFVKHTPLACGEDAAKLRQVLQRIGRRKIWSWERSSRDMTQTQQKVLEELQKSDADEIREAVRKVNIETVKESRFIYFSFAFLYSNVSFHYTNELLFYLLFVESFLLVRERACFFSFS